MRRNIKVMAARIQSLAARIHRFRMLKQLGFDTSMLLRTGGKQAMTYGLGVIGVSDSMLRDMRTVAAAIASPASGAGGQNLDAALIVADVGPAGWCGGIGGAMPSLSPRAQPGRFGGVGLYLKKSSWRITPESSSTSL